MTRYLRGERAMEALTSACPHRIDIPSHVPTDTLDALMEQTYGVPFLSDHMSRMQMVDDRWHWPVFETGRWGWATRMKTMYFRDENDALSFKLTFC